MLLKGWDFTLCTVFAFTFQSVLLLASVEHAGLPFLSRVCLLEAPGTETTGLIVQFV